MGPPCRAGKLGQGQPCPVRHPSVEHRTETRNPSCLHSCSPPAPQEMPRPLPAGGAAPDPAVSSKARRGAARPVVINQTCPRAGQSVLLISGFLAAPRPADPAPFLLIRAAPPHRLITPSKHRWSMARYKRLAFMRTGTLKYYQTNPKLPVR